MDKGYENYFFHNWQKAVFMNDKESKIQMDHYLKQLKVPEASAIVKNN
jgi:hypothetical protein